MSKEPSAATPRGERNEPRPKPMSMWQQEAYEAGHWPGATSSEPTPLSGEERGGPQEQARQIIAQWQAQWPNHNEADDALVEQIAAALAAERIILNNVRVAAEDAQQQLAAEKERHKPLMEALERIARQKPSEAAFIAEAALASVNEHP